MSVQKKRPGRPNSQAAVGGLTIRALAEQLGLEKSTVQEACQNGMPRTSVEAALEWRSKRPVLGAAVKSATIAEARLAKLNAETARLQFRLAVDRGEYLPIDQVREEATGIGSVLIAELSALANDLPGQLAGLSEVQIRDRLLARLDSLIETTRGKLQTLLNVRHQPEIEEHSH
jgi:hypothetical protein